MHNTTSSIRNTTTTTSTTSTAGLGRRLAHMTAAALAATAALAALGSAVQATDSTCGTTTDDASAATFGGFTGGVTVAVGDVDSGAAATTVPTTTPVLSNIEREMKESGEQGGTENINIGVGELQECSISKSTDSTSVMLAEYAIDGTSPDVVDSDDYARWQSNYGQTASNRGLRR